MDATLQEQLTQLIEPELVAKNLELFSIRAFKAGNRRVLSFAIDHATGGITLEECAEWNRAIGDLIEAKGLMADAYTVEVASPGLDRPLVTEKDYRRLVGRRVWFQYRGESRQLLETVRSIARVEDGRIFFQTADPSAPHEMRLEDVLRAKPEVLVN